MKWIGDIKWKDSGEYVDNVIFCDDTKIEEESEEDNTIFYYVNDEDELFDMVRDSIEDFEVIRFHRLGGPYDD